MFGGIDIIEVEPQRELSDLWPDLQDDFKRTVDAALQHREDQK